jgi:hypothetical protein
MVGNVVVLAPGRLVAQNQVPGMVMATTNGMLASREEQTPPLHPPESRFFLDQTL